MLDFIFIGRAGAAAFVIFRVTVSASAGFAGFGARRDFVAGFAVGFAVDFLAATVPRGFGRLRVASILDGFTGTLAFGAGAAFGFGTGVGLALATDGRPAFATGFATSFVAVFTGFCALAGVTGRVARGRAPAAVLIPLAGFRSSGTGSLTFGVTDTCVRLATAGRGVRDGFATGATGAREGLLGPAADAATTAVGVIIHTPMEGRARAAGAADRATPVALLVSPLPSFAAGRTAVPDPRVFRDGPGGVAFLTGVGRSSDLPTVRALAPATLTGVVSARPCLTFTLAAPTFRNECHITSVCLRDRILSYDATDVN